MAEELNRYFASVFTVEDTNNTPELQQSQGAVVNKYVAITKEKVLGNLKGLKLDKSCGPVGPHPKALKEIAKEIVEALVVIFQESLESGRVTEDWKVVNEITIKLDRGEPVDVMQLDFRKASDKVPHRR
eukprot:g18805.t1